MKSWTGEFLLHHTTKTHQVSFLCADGCVLLTTRWRRLKAQMIEKRSKLGESQTLQQFSRDVDEIEAWISEKLQTATDESYKDPTNIQVAFHLRNPAHLMNFRFVNMY